MNNYSNELTLLYVEDMIETREMFSLLLEDTFKEIILAKDGQEALEKIQQHSIDLIITDIQMPNMDGLEMMQAIKDLKLTIPIIILSAHIKPEYFLKSIKLNVKGYLIKPLDIDSLFDILDDILLNIKLQLELDEKNKTIAQNHKFLHSIINNSYDSIMVIEEDHSIKLMNSAAKKNVDTQYISDLKNPKCYEVLHHRSFPCDSGQHPCPLKDVITNKEHKTVVHSHTDMNDDMHHIEISAAPLLEENNTCMSIIETSRDITEHIMIQEQLRKQKDILNHKANHDTLTGLANRELFEDRLQQAIFKAKRNKTKVVLLFIDLDKFKFINDTYGHKAGDYVLQSVSSRMRKEILEKDSLARIGGDEFTLIIEKIKEIKDIQKITKKLIETIEKPIYYEDKTLTTSASIGISTYPKDTTDRENLLKYADIAMYKAKQHNRDILYYSKVENI